LGRELYDMGGEKWTEIIVAHMS